MGRIPSAEPSNKPSVLPTQQPSSTPTSVPTFRPTGGPSMKPTSRPSQTPSATPTLEPTTYQPSSEPSLFPTRVPSDPPSSMPSLQPTMDPTSTPLLVTYTITIYLTDSDTTHLDEDEVKQLIADALGINIADIISTKMNADGSLTVILSVAIYDSELVRSGIASELEQSGHVAEVEVQVGTEGETKVGGDDASDDFDPTDVLSWLSHPLYLGGVIGVLSVCFVCCVVCVVMKCRNREAKRVTSQVHRTLSSSVQAMDSTQMTDGERGVKHNYATRAHSVEAMSPGSCVSASMETETEMQPMAVRLMSVSLNVSGVVSDSAMSDGEEDDSEDAEEEEEEDTAMYKVMVSGKQSPGMGKGMDSDEPGHTPHKGACESAELPEDESEQSEEDTDMYKVGAGNTAQSDADLYSKGKAPKTRKGSASTEL